MGKHQMIPYMGYLNYTEIITTSNNEYSQRHKVHSGIIYFKLKLMSGPSCSGEKGFLLSVLHLHSQFFLSLISTTSCF